MAVKFPRELAATQQADSGRDLDVVDREPQQTDLVVDAHVDRMTTDSLRRLQDYKATTQGLAVEAGEGTALEEARMLTRVKILARNL